MYPNISLDIKLATWHASGCDVCRDSEAPYIGLLSPRTYTKRGQSHPITEITGHRLCKRCYLADVAIEEADFENRKYTEVRVHEPWAEEANYFGHRCQCGNVIISSKNLCFECSRSYRMLEKKVREAKLIKKLLTELNSEIRVQKRAEKLLEI